MNLKTYSPINFQIEEHNRILKINLTSPTLELTNLHGKYLIKSFTNAIKYKSENKPLEIYKCRSKR
jgi:hypothetical protein